MTRKDTNDALVAWVKSQAAAYRSDIALIAVYGSYINGTAGERSDVDMYFVPRTERAMEFARTFIIGGVE